MNMLDRYIKYVLSHPKKIIVIISAITLVLGTGVPRLNFDNSLEVMMPKKDTQYLYYEEVKKVYGNLGKFIIMNITCNDLWSPKTLSLVNDLITDLEEYKDSDESKENRRIQRLRDLSSSGEIEPAVLLNNFRDDAPFSRELERYIQAHYRLGTKLSKSNLKRIHDHIVETAKLKKKRHIDAVLSPLTAKDISGTDDTLTAKEIIDKDLLGKRKLPASPKDILNFQKRLTKNPAFKGALYSTDPRTGVITDFCVMVKLENIKKDDDITKRVWDIAAGYKALTITPQGVPIIGIKMNDYMHRDLYTFLPLVILVIVIVFYLNFRSVRGVILPFCTLIIGDIWVLGLMGYLGYSITIIGISLPPLIIAVGSSYSIHILNQYYLYFSEIGRMGKSEGLRSTMSHISVTIILAGGTTFIGFISLLTNQVVGIREWGLFSAVGVLFSVIISSSLIPACLMLLPHSRTKKKIVKRNGDQVKTRIDLLVGVFIRLSTRHPRSVLAVTVLILIISMVGLTRVKVETTLSAYFKEHDYVRTSSRLIAEKYGGSYGMSILIDSGESDGIKNPEFLRTVEEIRHWLTSTEDLHIGRTDAFPDIIKTMHMAMNNDSINYYRIPDSRVDIMDYLEIYTGADDDFDGRADEFEPYLDPEYRTALIFARLGESGNKILGTAETKIIHDRVAAYLNSKLTGPAAYKITGEPSIFIRLSEYVVQGQLFSLLFSLAAVCLVVVLLFKNLKAGLLSMIPISVAILINFGLMGWTGIRLDIATAIIASLTIGIGVDDTIHFLNTYRHYNSHNLSPEEIIAKTISTSGKAIIYTSLALIFGFSVLVVSSFSPVVYFGILAGNTMIATTMGALLILPSVIITTGVSLEKSKSSSWFWRYFYIGRFFNIKESDC